MFRGYLLCFSLRPFPLVLSLGTGGSVFFASLIQAFIYSVRFRLHLLFSRLNSPSHLNLSLQQRCSRPLNTLVSLAWTLSGMFMCLLYWGAWNWVQHSKTGLTSAEHSTTPDLLAVLCLRSPGYHLLLCESAQAGCRNKHKNISKIHRVCLFLLLHQLGILKTAPRYTSRDAGTAEPGPR